ncbi:DUF2867 domain-containing protein [Stenotrophomonas sp.]|uniref:DUF2867 domain-containing protein n=1 Tax=Stenotrophomonas sp. TaxID=69392 RepID=UPI0028B03140|nr:DUF2867 domain-containing protein [Stenotrophomonas sp.]
MLDVTLPSRSFPSIHLPSVGDGSPVEVTVITRLGIGAGDQAVNDAGARQAAHPQFVDALDEPSARLGDMHLAHGDASSLYSFAVGPQGHPFHRHAGPRMFTAIAGSGGAQLRFSTVTDAQLDHAPAAFVQALRCVDIPPDCLFTVRFGGGTWHQFVSRRPPHPALFALSCHPDDRAGALSDAQRARVADGSADLPTLTDTLPPVVQHLLDELDMDSVPRVTLSMQAPSRGHVRRPAAPMPVTRHPAPPADSLLRHAFPDGCHHQDHAFLTLPPRASGTPSARRLLEAVLDGFVRNPPASVGRLMALRNVLVAPLRLRTSPLGCPVSSLLSEDRRELFAGRFPVLAQALAADDRRAEVMLGADDRHLQFRSCVSVQYLEDGSARVSLGTRVRTLNRFGRIYMLLIDHVHRHYIGPTLLRRAVEHALAPASSGTARDTAVQPSV